MESQSNKEFIIPDIAHAPKVVNSLVEQHFVGENAVLLQSLMAGLSFGSVGHLVESFLQFLDKRIDVSTLNFSDIEELNLSGLAIEFATSMQVNDEALQALDFKNEGFTEAIKQFSHSTLHELIFPIITMGNPNAAVSTVNLIKRSIASLPGGETDDLTEVYEGLGLEDVPTEFSEEVFIKLIERFPYLDLRVQIEESIDNTVEIEALEGYTENYLPSVRKSKSPPILHCELTPDQAICLSFDLEENHDAIKKRKKLHGLLKSYGKDYGSVIVKSEKIGLVLSIIIELHNRKTSLNTRYLYIIQESGIWTFFEQYLIDSKTDQPFARGLSQLLNENPEHEKAKEIIDYLLNPNNQPSISKRASQISNKKKSC